MNTSRIVMSLMAVSVGALFALSGPAWSDDKGKERHHTKEMVEMSKTAKVTADQAIKTASEKVQGKVIEAELERKHDKAVWEVEIVGDGDKVMEVHIDADSGAVIDVEEKGAEKKKGKKKD
jgi:uncharacterized membrane protein YkoI